MPFHKIGGLAALACAGTYLFGFAYLVTVLAPLGFGTGQIDAAAVVAFIAERPGALILFNTVIYIVNALALAVLVVALAYPLGAPSAVLTLGLGLIWAALVLGAGMMGNVTVEQVLPFATADPAYAAELWRMLHAVELGLGGGNEIAGGAWIGLTSLVARNAGRIGKVTMALGLLTGAGGLLTLIPAIGDVAGAVFGLSAIAWFIAVGVLLLRARIGDTTPGARET